MKSLLKIIDFAKWILWGLLLCGVYSETGPYTTAILVVVLLRIELSNRIRNKTLIALLNDLIETAKGITGDNGHENSTRSI